MNETVGRAGQMPPPTALEPLGEAECWTLLRTHTLGRVAVIVNGRPEIFPVNYRAAEGVVVFRTGPGTKLTSGPMTRSCFEIDGWDGRSGEGWSVMVHGTISEITDAIDSRAVRWLELPVQPAAPGERAHWLALYADQVTGRSFSSGSPAPQP